MSAQTLQAGGIKFTLPAYLKPFRAAANLGLPAGRSAALNFAPKKTENSASALSEKLRVRAGNGLLWIMLLLPVVLVLAACHSKTKANVPEVRPVRTVVAAKREAGETTVLTGHVEAENEVALAFRISGRMIERPVNIGDRVRPGQVVAKLDPQNELNTLRSARANLAAAQAQSTQARNTFERQRRLLDRGVSSRAEFDQAQEALQTAQSQVDDAEAQVKIAQDRVSYTELDTDVAGAVTARGAEPGEVVQAGQMIVRVARQDGRDAVFDVCSLNVTAKDMAVMAATLANGGVNPLTKKRIIDAVHCQHVLAVMVTAGLYENSGDWLYEIGLPGKSGVSGGMVTVAPGKGGLGTFAPPLDNAGNSVKGRLAAKFLSEQLGLNLFASRPAENE